jgi:hypothetical protein
MSTNDDDNVATSARSMENDKDCVLSFCTDDNGKAAGGGCGCSGGISGGGVKEWFLSLLKSEWFIAVMIVIMVIFIFMIVDMVQKKANKAVDIPYHRYRSMTLSGLN